MKQLYVVMLFVIFFNIFAFMFASINLFPYVSSEGVNEDWNISDGENLSAENLTEQSTGYSFDNILSYFFMDIKDLNPINLLITLATLGGAVIAAYITRSPAPLVVGFVGNMVKNVYINNYTIFESLPLNNYMMLAVGVGMIILFLLTCAEILSHSSGDI